MSAPPPLSVMPQTGGYELTGAPLDIGEERSSSRRGLLAITGLLITGAVIALGAAHTSVLIPQSVQLGVPASLAGAFNAVGFDLHSGGTIAAMAAMFGCYVVAVSAAGQLSARTVLTAIAALYALVLWAPPLISTDVFSYQAYARMGALYATNPYTHGPHAIFLDGVFPYLGAKWSYIPSVYGPVFTVFSYALAPLSIAASVFAYKSIAALASLGLVALVWHCARLRGKDPVRAAVFVGLNPLLIINGVGGGHNDMLMLLVMVAGLYAVLRSRERLGGGLVMLAAGIKLTAGLMLPFALAAGGPHRGRARRDLIFGAGIVAALTAAVTFALFGSGSLEMLATVDKSQSEGGWQSIPGFVGNALGSPTVGHIVGYSLAAVFVLISLWLLRRVWQGRTDWIDGAGWATVAMLVAASALLPWYVAWALPLAALGHDRRLARAAIVLTGVILGIQLLGMVPHGSGVL
jgi:Glycosyltransferase family 87